MLRLVGDKIPIYIGIASDTHVYSIWSGFLLGRCSSGAEHNTAEGEKNSCESKLPLRRRNLPTETRVHEEQATLAIPYGV